MAGDLSVVQRIRDNIGKVIIGKEETIDLLLTALLAKGHVLMEDVPGTGKTKLAKAVAKSIGGEYSRIQFTPDLLPSDITGINMYDQSKQEFVLKKGPVFTHILLADEINRATPRTQAGLLECMEERQVTIDGQTYELSEPFFCIATQNPVETSGTFPLPEAQLDRFIMRLSMGLPNHEEELRILDTYMTKDPIEELVSVATCEDIIELRNECNKVFVHPLIKDYLVNIIEETRNGSKTVLGVSTRGSLAMLRALKAYAFINNRSFVTPDDVKKLAVPVLAHRILISYGYTKRTDAEKLIEDILGTIPVPTEDFSK